jgi:hypothetical protein
MQVHYLGSRFIQPLNCDLCRVIYIRQYANAVKIDNKSDG